MSRANAVNCDLSIDLELSRKTTVHLLAIRRRNKEQKVALSAIKKLISAFGGNSCGSCVETGTKTYML
jgi:hypothetical protein